MAKTKIGILGAGYAGLLALKVLQSKAKDVEITLIDRNSYHYEATDFHEVAAGSVKADKITYPIADVVKPGITNFIQASVTKIDKANKTVEIEGHEPMTFDYLIVALGFRSETFGIKGATEFALPMDDIETSEAVYKHFIAKLEDYRTSKNPENLKVLIAGAGFTGMELIGAMAENKAKYAKIAGVTPDDIELTCIDAAPSLLPMFPSELADYAVKRLADKGAKVYTSRGINEVKEGVVVAQNMETKELIEFSAGTIIWTTGVSGSDVITESGYEARRNRVMVTSQLKDPENDKVYILGDVSAVMDAESGRPYPTTAQIALVMGHVAATNILADMNSTEAEDFKYVSQGTVCSLGNTDAIGVLGNGAKVKGYIASALKKIIMNKSLWETGGVKEVLAKGRFDLYH